MPGYKAHLFAGALIAFLLIFLIVSVYAVPLQTVAVWSVCALLGALFPDIDIKSKGQKIFFRTLFIVALIFALQAHEFALMAVGMIMVVPLIARHRGLTHQWWFVVVCPLILVFIGSLYYPAILLPMCGAAAFFIAGALSHVALDRLW